MVASCCPWPLYMLRRKEQHGRCMLGIRTVLNGGRAKHCGVSFAEEIKMWAEQAHCEGFPETGEPHFSNSPHQNIS